MHPPVVSGNTSLLLYLRQGTQRPHFQVEHHPVLAPLTGSNLCTETYARILSIFLGYYETVESALQCQLEPLLARHQGTYRYLPRTELIRADLRDLGRGNVGRTAAPGHNGLPAPRIENAAQALGFLYVLEGATQGGRIIGPRVAARLGLTESHGARYFNLYARKQWQCFRALAQECEPLFAPEPVLKGAQQAFETLSLHLDTWMRPSDRNGNHAQVHPTIQPS